MSKEILISKKLIKQSEVIDAASRVVKDKHRFDDPKTNTSDISTRLLNELDSRLHELGLIEMDIADWEINNG